jgi:hypothetical protein
MSGFLCSSLNNGRGLNSHLKTNFRSKRKSPDLSVIDRMIRAFWWSQGEAIVKGKK